MQAGRPNSNTTDTLVGKVIGSNYRLVRRIGAGGMGAVYEARHTEQGTRAAVKVLNRELAQDTTLLERFRREAKITASLSNPHTVKVFGFDQPADGLPYMIMEYLEGEDLDTRLKRVQRLTMPEAEEVLRGLSVALSDAHRAGVVHRDLKPANIFYAREGSGERVKLLDFGLSKAMKLSGEGLTFFGQILGTVWYMSPEQTRGAEATALSDIYSVGVVLYQALTGELPYAAATPQEYLYRIQTGTPRPLSEVAPDLPAGLEAVLLQSMAREPAERFSAIRDLNDAFAGLSSGSSDATSMTRVPTDPRLRTVPVTPRAVTDPKLRAMPANPRITGSRPALDMKSKPPMPAKAVSDPNVRSARPPSLSNARPVSVPQARTVLSMPAPVIPTPQPMPALSDATVVRPFMAPAAEGEDGTYVPQRAPEPAPLDTEGATRIGPAPSTPPIPVGAPVPRFKSSPPMVRPTTDPDDQVPERVAPAPQRGSRAPRPMTEPEMTVPGSRPNPFLAATSREAEATPVPQHLDTPIRAPQSTNVFLVLVGVGAGLGMMLLIGALLWRVMH